ncbi:MAG: tetratricopeptide repeat protein [Desulfomonile tiedjei]|nr:tetratricopeptide repeat protein [Desulfomonile tiedjei]
MKDKVISEFRRLFWAARAEHVKQRPSADGDTPAHKKAMDYTLEHGLEWGEALLLASLNENRGKAEDALKLLDSAEKKIPATEKGYLWFLKGSAFQTLGRPDDAIKAYHEVLEDPEFDTPGKAWYNLGVALAEKGEHDEAIKAFRKAPGDPNYDTPGRAWYNLGFVLARKGEYDEAIKSYRKALEDPRLETPGKAWYNLGFVLARKGEYDEAIKAYHRALEDPNFDTPGKAWNNLGLVLADKGEYDEAIKAYHKALENPDFDIPGYAWNNLGVALKDKGNYDEAIKAFHKALEDPKNDTPGKAWNNLGLALKDRGKNEEAIDAFRQALEDPKLRKEEPWASRARSVVALLESGLRKESLSTDDRALLESKPSIGMQPTPEERILAKIEVAGETQYDKYWKRQDSDRDNVLSILRGWSSSVPLLEGSERVCSGGGYFLKWQGKGIVIDPGFDFLQNFHDAGYHGREIHAVLVSHNHSDHNFDLKSIDHLRYELDGVHRRLHKKGMVPYALVWDEETKTAVKFDVEKPKHQFKPVVFDTGRAETDRKIKDLHKLPFSVEYFPVRHAKEEVPNAVGIKLHLTSDDGSNLTIGYTGDTGFFKGLARDLVGCDLLVAHISQPTTKELLNPAARKKNHLGYRGLIELVKACKPKATLVSEFWAGLTDLRIDLVQAIRERTGTKAILPASIGMHIHLPSLEVQCTQCPKTVPFEKVRVAPPANRFGNLSYLCESCMIGG